MSNMQDTQEPRGPRQRAQRGFAAMDENRQRAIASQGGRAAHAQGVAHEFDAEEARAAGRKGGQAVSQDRAHMAMIGALGGKARAEGFRAREAMRTQDRDVASGTPSSNRSEAQDSDEAARH